MLFHALFRVEIAPSLVGFRMWKEGRLLNKIIGVLSSPNHAGHCLALWALCSGRIFDIYTAKRDPATSGLWCSDPGLTPDVLLGLVTLPQAQDCAQLKIFVVWLVKFCAEGLCGLFVNVPQSALPKSLPPTSAWPQGERCGELKKRREKGKGKGQGWGEGREGGRKE